LAPGAVVRNHRLGAVQQALRIGCDGWAALTTDVNKTPGKVRGPSTHIHILRTGILRILGIRSREIHHHSHHITRMLISRGIPRISGNYR
jgi:hypothetical protein